jgi:hypothetical protein
LPAKLASLACDDKHNQQTYHQHQRQQKRGRLLPWRVRHCPSPVRGRACAVSSCIFGEDGQDIVRMKANANGRRTLNSALMRTDGCRSVTAKRKKKRNWRSNARGEMKQLSPSISSAPGSSQNSARLCVLHSRQFPNSNRARTRRFLLSIFS